MEYLQATASRTTRYLPDWTHEIEVKGCFVVARSASDRATPQDWADMVKRIAGPVPGGYVRDRQEYVMDMTGTRLEFTVVDLYPPRRKPDNEPPPEPFIVESR